MVVVEMVLVEGEIVVASKNTLNKKNVQDI